ncbi:hypothetical protein T281_12370 [Rhodomicrobium udaipurense JA643]|nr:hypothetical protein T281_12370 [Rhodomicrobium udaipurense JA643]
MHRAVVPGTVRDGRLRQSGSCGTLTGALPLRNRRKLQSFPFATYQILRIIKPSLEHLRFVKEATPRNGQV